MLAIYKRVSTEDQSNTGISLDNQELRGKELAAKLGLNFKVYSDGGYSGTIPFDKRPALKALIDDIYKGAISGIFVIDLDRLSRGDILQTTLLQNIFKENNVRLFDLNGEINLKDINVALLTDIRSLLNAYEIKKTSARIKTVLEKNVRDGKVTGGPIINYGYTKDEKKMLIIDKNEAKVVKLIYQLALEGKGTKVISNILNEKKIPTKRGNITTGKAMMVRGIKKTEFVWRDATIYRILTNTIYKGQRLYQGNYYSAPAIIDDTTFDLVQTALKNNNQFKDTTNIYDFLLKGLIACPVCGGKYYGHKRANGNDNAYTCNSNRYGKNCGNRGISIDFLDNLVCETILVMDKMIENALSESNQDTTTIIDLQKLDNINNAIVETQTKIDNLLNMAEVNSIEPATFKTRLSERQNELNKLIEDREQLNHELLLYKEKGNIVLVANKAIKTFKKLKEFGEKRDFIRSIVSHIVIGWDTIESVYGVAVFFKLNNFENYLISRKLVIDRNTRKDGKAFTKILTEKVAFQYSHYLADDKDASIYSVPHINYGDPVSFFKFKRNN